MLSIVMCTVSVKQTLTSNCSISKQLEVDISLILYYTVSFVHLNKCASHLMWVPVRVKNNHSVGRLQVEAKASSSCAQEEDKVL